MFVKIVAVLYELRLERLEAANDKKQQAYKRAFKTYYKLADEYSELLREYNAIPSCMRSEKDKLEIDAAGGRQSKALTEMNRREVAAGKSVRAISRTENRIASIAKKTSSQSSREQVFAASSAVAILR